MATTVITSLALSLSLTLVLEAGIFLLIGKRDKKDLLLVILVNVITNPAVVMLYWLGSLYTAWNMNLVLIPLELLAIFVEGYYYDKYGRDFRRPYMFSVGANMFSFGVGLAIQRII